MALFDDTTDDGYGSFKIGSGYVDGFTYLTDAADAATKELLSSAYDNEDEACEGRDISSEYAPVSHDDLPGNDSYEQLEGLLADERVAAIIEHYSITPESFGYDFTLTRNHEGAGFWCRGYYGFNGVGNLTSLTLPNDGDYLTEMAQQSEGAIVSFTRDNDGDIQNLYLN
jgi:hypothetical protein